VQCDVRHISHSTYLLPYICIYLRSTGNFPGVGRPRIPCPVYAALLRPPTADIIVGKKIQ